MSYLSKRIASALNVRELEPKEMTLNALMTAFTVRVGANDIDATITKNVTGAAKHFANKLFDGKFVVIHDPIDLRNYYVKAFGDDLVAVFHSMHSSLDFYGIVGSNPGPLVHLGIESECFNDNKIIDKIFGFRPDVKSKPVEVPPPVMSSDAHVGLKHDWFVMIKPVEKNDAKDEFNELPRKDEKIIADVRAKPHAVSRPGQTVPLSRDRLSEVVAAASPSPSSQMGQALQNANVGKGNQGQRREQDRQGGAKGQQRQGGQPEVESAGTGNQQ